MLALSQSSGCSLMGVCWVPAVCRALFEELSVGLGTELSFSGGKCVWGGYCSFRCVEKALQKGGGLSKHLEEPGGLSREEHPS